MFERLRMMRFAIAGMTLACLLVMSGCQTALGAAFLAWQLGVFDKKNKNSNNPPQILTLTAVPNTVQAGGSVTLTVVAVDADSGDTLSYQWAAPAGTLSTPNAQVTLWMAPSDNTGTFYINVVVTDGKDPVTGKIPVTVTL